MNPHFKLVKYSMPTIILFLLIWFVWGGWMDYLFRNWWLALLIVGPLKIIAAVGSGIYFLIDPDFRKWIRKKRK